MGPQWETRWQETGSRLLAAGEFFLIVDRNWTTTADFDAQVALGLQNGPDAIRLVCGGIGLDMVGYGNLTDPLMREGQAVPLPTGLGLGRHPDGHDTDDNAADFRPVAITPGWRNFPDHALELVSAAWDPPCAAYAGQNLCLDLAVRNAGLLDLPPTTLELVWVSAEGEPLLALNTAFAGCRAAETWAARLTCPAPGEGRHGVRLDLLPSPGAPGLSLDLGSLQVGPATLILNEVLHLPSAGQGEWLELLARQDLSTAGMNWRDEDGEWRPLPLAQLAAGAYLVVAQDSTALGAWARQLEILGIPVECEGASLLQGLRSPVGGWPNLNNSPPAGRPFAERLLLSDADGVVVDQIVLPADGQGGLDRGRSWERSGPEGDALWRACLAPAGGTPGCANSVAGFGSKPIPAPGLLVIRPAVLDRASASPLVHLVFAPPMQAVAWHLEVYDLWGERVRDLGGGVVSGSLDDPSSGNLHAGDWLWDGRDEAGQDVASGAYIVVLLLARGTGALQPADRALVVVR